MGAPIYEVVVIGSGPAGQKGAINAAKLHKRVALIDRRPMLGGVSVHTGTIPSKTVREAILHLTGFTERTFYGRDYSLKENISVQDLAFRVNTIVERETQVIHAQLKRNGVAVFEGTARFTDPHTVEVANDDRPVTLNAERVLIACGTRPCRPRIFPSTATASSTPISFIPCRASPSERSS